MEMWMVTAGFILTQKRSRNGERQSANWMDEGGGGAFLRIASALGLIGLMIGALCLACGGP